MTTPQQKQLHYVQGSFYLYGERLYHDQEAMSDSVASQPFSFSTAAACNRQIQRQTQVHRTAVSFCSSARRGSWHFSRNSESLFLLQLFHDSLVPEV